MRAGRRPKHASARPYWSTPTRRSIASCNSAARSWTNRWPRGLMPKGLRRVCLVTTGQPSTNPRLVKEADALAAAGYLVTVVGAFGGDWAIEADRSLLATRTWPFDLIDWRRERQPLLFWKSRVRQRVAQPLSAWSRAPIEWAEAAVARPAPELAREAMQHPADLYIAHNLGALP